MLPKLFMRWKPHSKHKSNHRSLKHSQRWVFLESEVSPIAEKKLVNFCTRQYIYELAKIQILFRNKFHAHNAIFYSNLWWYLHYFMFFIYAIHLHIKWFAMILQIMMQKILSQMVAYQLGRADGWVTIQILYFPIHVLKSTTTKCSHELWYSCFIFYFLVHCTLAA